MRDVNPPDESTCPTCGTAVTGATGQRAAAEPPADSVRVWMTEQDWSRPLLTRDVYSAYLVEHGAEAVDRERFVRDLTRFGVREEPDAEGRRFLTCP